MEDMEDKYTRSHRLVDLTLKGNKNMYYQLGLD